MNIASISFGKDSLAMCLVLIEKGYPLDEVIFYDTGMEFPALYKEKKRFTKYFETHSVKVTTLYPPRPFLYDMLLKPVKKRDGSIQYGYQWCGGPCRWGTMYKTLTIDNYLKGKNIEHHYVGIAADENRPLNKEKDYPLIEWGMTEKDCLEYCYKHGAKWEQDGVKLYDILDRVSCWCCKNKNKKELQNIKEFLPQTYVMLERLQRFIEDEI